MILAHVLDVAAVAGGTADDALRIASRLLDGRQAAGRGLARSVALEVARRDAADLTAGLRAQAERILELAESLDAELGPGIPRYKVTLGEPEVLAGPGEVSSPVLLDGGGPAPGAQDGPRTGARWRRIFSGRGAETAR